VSLVKQKVEVSTDRNRPLWEKGEMLGYTSMSLKLILMGEKILHRW